MDNEKKILNGCMQYWESVTERDIDFAFMELLNTDENFAMWFIKKCNPEFELQKCDIAAYHSVCSNKGETDILIRIKYGKERCAVILVENKINAIAQKQQPQRYKKRAEEWKQKFACVDFVKYVIVAPDNYLKNNDAAKEYQEKISYENIIGKLSEFSKNKIYRYKSKMFEMAISQERRGYFAIKDEAITAFWNVYYEYVCQYNNGETFFMNKPGAKPGKSKWIQLKCYWFRDKTHYSIYHKCDQGSIDFQIPKDQDIEVIANFYQEKFPDLKIEIKFFKKTHALRIKNKDFVFNMLDPLNEEKVRLERVFKTMSAFAIKPEII